MARWSAGLPKPKAILMVSAHWEAAPLSIGATRQAPLVYDFWGFPEHYYRVRYDAPGAPELADDVRELLPGVRQEEERGLDHGAYVPLVEMYPDADVPVLQMDALLDFRAKAPAARIAHPRTEHFAPLFMAIGADADTPSGRRSVIDGYWFGLAKRSFQFG